jgi:hypothetical protein
MAKAIKDDSRKVTFGKKKRGVMKKNYGPKSPAPKRYKGQGR